VKVVDANVLLYAVDERARHHEASRQWLNAALSNDEPVGFAWLVLLAFLRLSTHPGVYPRPLGLDQALDVLHSWLSQPPAVVLEAGTRHLSTLRDVLTPTGTGGNLVNDGHLAALALERRATVVTFDNDFSRFPGARWMSPAGYR
jgi:uncharacterized protein